MRQLLSRTTRVTTVAVVVAVTAMSTGAGPDATRGVPRGADEMRLVAAAERSGTGPDRRVVRYTVRPGDTATGLAVRFHAWTTELVALNRLGPTGSLVVGQRLRIPVVVSAARAARRTVPTAAGGERARPGRPSRAHVKRVLVRTAHAYDVDPHLALAVSWQEAGWQMHHVSAAHAIGAMQVLPSTGRWMSAYVGRPLRLRRLHDNAAAGVMLLRVLRDQAPLRRAVAGYYQGLAGVREHGMYPDTRAYVRNVLALRRMLGRGWDPS